MTSIFAYCLCSGFHLMWINSISLNQMFFSGLYEVSDIGASLNTSLRRVFKIVQVLNNIKQALTVKYKVSKFIFCMLNCSGADINNSTVASGRI